jgi:cephalosporin hydroxylase
MATHQNDHSPEVATPTHPIRWLREQRSIGHLFTTTGGPIVDKWESYFRVYERHLSSFRKQRPTMLEIGVSHGGSIAVWQRWLGRGCTLVGIDIEPRCAQLSRRGVSIEIGDQSDLEFLADVARRHGPFDIVLDDGSHFGDHQVATLDVLWPHLNDNAVYMVEDLHTNYWERKRGGLRRPGTFVEYAKSIADDLTAFHSETDDFVPTGWTSTVESVTFHDSIVVIEKHLHGPSERVTAGRPVFPDLYGAPVEQRLTPEHWERIERMNRPLNRAKRALRSPRSSFEQLRRRTASRFRGMR